MTTDGKYLLAIDLGTGGPKVALASTTGDILAHEIERTQLFLLPKGGAEQDPDDWWRAITTAAKRLLVRAVVPTDRIVAISCTSQWVGTVPVDRDGRHLMNAIIWMDSRGGPYSSQLTAGRVRVAGYGVSKLRKWLTLTGGVPSRTGKDSIGHILFLQHERPEIYRQAYKLLEPMDYLNMRLTGQFAASYDTITTHWVTDNRDLSNVHYDDGLLKMSGVDRSKLPDLRPTCSVLGLITKAVAAELGLRDDVQVVTGTPDTESAAVGSGAVRDFAPHLYIGTSSWLTCHVPYKKVDVLNNLTSLPSGVPGKYLIATEQDVAGACLTTLRDSIFFHQDELSEGPPPADFFERLNRMAERIPPGSDKLLYFPWLNGERTPVEDHHLRGGFLNLSLTTTRAHMVRAVFEGVAYNTRWMMRQVEKYTRRKLNDINFIGGGADSALWCQIHADVLDRRIRRVRQPRLANARGAAFLACVALGYIKVDDIPERVQIDATYEPNSENRAIYDELFREFVGAYRSNRKMYARLNGR